MTRAICIALGLLLAWSVASPALAETPGSAVDPAVGKVTNLPIPRFVSIRADEANLRVGPGGHYPIRWRLLRSGMPAKVIDEEGQWLEIVLHDGDRGWLHKQLLSGARSLYVTADQAPILADPKRDADVVAYAQKRVIFRANACKADWCEVRKGEIRGWVSSHMVWGVFPDESFE